jgi:hypothetical protein
MDASTNGHIKQSNPIVEWVWYEGADALREGEAVCFNTDYGTATSVDCRRNNRVERPTTSNNKAFAGVAARDYSAKSGGQFIEIYAPGSKGVKIALAVDTVIGTGLLTFTVAGKYNVGASTGLKTDAGRFYTGKYLGRGSAIPRQTVTAVLEASMVGAWSLAADGVTLTVAATAGLAAGDTVVLLGGEDDGTGTVIPGKYTISSVTNGTVLVLTASAVDVTPDGALTCTGYAYTGNPTCQADLLTGDEAGGVEFINLPNTASDTNPYMVGGVSYVCGGITLSADNEIDFAQGTLPGETKAFIMLGALTTHDFVVDLATTGLSIDGSTALTEFQTIDDAGDGCFLVFNGAKWHCLDLLVGATQYAS